MSAKLCATRAKTNQFRQVVEGFAQKELAPRAAEIDKSNHMPEVSPPLMRFQSAT